VTPNYVNCLIKFFLTASFSLISGMNARQNCKKYNIQVMVGYISPPLQGITTQKTTT
jgi:hypothetical protein